MAGWFYDRDNMLCVRGSHRGGSSSRRGRERIVKLNGCRQILRRAVKQVGGIVRQPGAAVRLRHRAADETCCGIGDGNNLFPPRMPGIVIVGILQTACSCGDAFVWHPIPNGSTALPFVIPTGPGFPATLHPDIAACAAFSKESSMKFANANKFHRKSGGA